MADLPAVGDEGRRVAYVTTRFPSVTQTFVFREILALEASGWEIHLHAFGRSDLPEGAHPETGGLAQTCVYPELRSLLQSQLWWLRRRPTAYLKVWMFALRGHWPSPRGMLNAIRIVPVAAMFARGIARSAITHTHAHWATGPALAAAVIARLTGGSYSFTAHAYDIQLDRTMLREKASGASFVTTISDLNRELLERECRGTSARVKVVHCGVDRRQFPPRTGPPATRPFVILNVAALQPYKGQKHLLGAVALLRRRGYDVEAHFVGAGPELRRLRRAAAQLRVEAAVRFLGVLSGDALRRSLDAAHVFALPSIELPSGLTEGIPVALMEAMAVGVPVVASRVGAVHELVVNGVTGLLVPPGDAEALAAAVAKLLDDPVSASRLATAAAEEIAAEFDVRETTRGLAGLFSAVLG
jgi:colanic acid/amylovoran biosynthesis glycosyltransferase